MPSQLSRHNVVQSLGRVVATGPGVDSKFSPSRLRAALLNNLAAALGQVLEKHDSKNTLLSVRKTATFFGQSIEFCPKSVYKYRTLCLT